MRRLGSLACSLAMRMVWTPHRPQCRSRSWSSALRVRRVVVGPVDLDDHGAAVADHDDVRGAHGRVAELGPGQRQHGEGVLGGVPLDVHQDLVDGQLGAAAEDEAVLGRDNRLRRARAAPGCRVPPGGPGLPVAPAGGDGGQLRGGRLRSPGTDILASVVREHGAQRLPDAAR